MMGTLVVKRLTSLYKGREALEVRSEPFQISKMESLVNIINGFESLTIFRKISS